MRGRSIMELPETVRPIGVVAGLTDAASKARGFSAYADGDPNARIVIK
jgi:hypothetical protein